jgi:hypothetical protein
MINFHPNIVSTLNEVLPTHYEMTLTSKTATPCISYMELNNSSAETGDTQEYSRITYQVKVWANDILTIQQYVPEVDRAMKSLGFKRISSNEMHDRQSTMI